MSLSCPYCLKPSHPAEDRKGVVRFGSFLRRSDSALVQRFRCLLCKRSFSEATPDPCYRQRKRYLNQAIAKFLISGVSQRRLALLMGINRKTVVRKFIFMGLFAHTWLLEKNLEYPKSTIIEFDDLETFEHTKCKPLSITLAVEYPTRRILGFRVSRMPAKGHLSEIARKKYGFRKDERKKARCELFEELQNLIVPHAIIKSDENPHYANDVRRYFPNATHHAYKGKRGCITGQGELKKVGFDPIFRLNHTCARLRADINRLFRRTWCTTEKARALKLSSRESTRFITTSS